MESILWKLFQLFQRILNYVTPEKTRPFNADFILEPSQESLGVVPALSYCSVLRNFYQNRPVCWSAVVKEKPTVGSPFFGPFLSDSVPKATKDVNVYLFIQLLHQLLHIYKIYKNLTLKH